jgi:hypothetical protein
MSAEFLSVLRWILMLSLLAGCSGDPGSGPVKVKWDRDACERCRMVLSDRSHAAEIRYYAPNKQRSSVALFDDIGCATLWLEQQPWRDDPRTEIWVIDHQSGEWIDARSATYVTGRITPMEYGLGAQAQPAPGGMNFAQAKKHIEEVEQRFNVHGQELLERLREQAERRQAETADDAPLPPIAHGAQ